MLFQRQRLAMGTSMYMKLLQLWIQEDQQA